MKKLQIQNQELIRLKGYDKKEILILFYIAITNCYFSIFYRKNFFYGKKYTNF